MTDVILKKDERKTLCSQEGYLASQKSSNEDDILNSLQRLEADEVRITEQKEHLTALLKKLEIQQVLPKSNGCPKNIEYFSKKPRPKEPPEECLTSKNLLTCVCLTSN